MFDVELEILDLLDALGQPLLVAPGSQPAKQFRADGVIAATGIADGDDDRVLHERLRLWTNPPSP